MTLRNDELSIRLTADSRVYVFRTRGEKTKARIYSATPASLARIDRLMQGYRANCPANVRVMPQRVFTGAFAILRSWTFAETFSDFVSRNDGGAK